MNARYLEPEWLSAFVAVVDGGGFTRAAERLHSTQSTVSQRIKRLEERLGAPVLERSTRSVLPTEQGELLLGYARRLLALNDEALEALAGTRVQGGVRLGAAQEIADGGLADLLAHFARLHPGVRLEVRVDANQRLLQGVEQGDLDLAVLFREPGAGAVPGEVIERLRRVWVAAPGLRLAADRPVPLVLADAPCPFRTAAIGALDRAGVAWRVVLTTPSLSGIRAAVRAGLGVTVRTEYWLEQDLQVLERRFPPLPDVELALLAAPDAKAEVVDKLRAALREALTGQPAGGRRS